MSKQGAHNCLCTLSKPCKVLIIFFAFSSQQMALTSGLELRQLPVHIPCFTKVGFTDYNTVVVT